MIVADLLVAFVAAAAWLGAGGAAAFGRRAMARALSIVGVAATLARLGTVSVLAGHGWWFVQEKVLLGLPLAVGTVAVAVPGLLRLTATSLLACGYAAAASFVVTFLIGYPLEPGTALIVVAAVGLVALRSRWRIAIGAVGLVGIGLAVVPSPSVAADHSGHGVAVTSLRGPVSAPVVRRFELTARTGPVALPSGREVDAWSFNGQVPGPQLTVDVGNLVEVRLRNDDIATGVTLHWHGVEVPAGEDGVPGLTQEAVPPGHEFTYRFIAPRAGSFWYHTHAVSDEGVRMGLYGSLIVRSPREPAPVGIDLLVAAHTFGDRVDLGVGDRAVPTGTPVRLRLLNTDSTPHRFALGGTAFRVVAVDGSDLHEPGDVTGLALRLAAGGRYDVAFVMPPGGVALAVGGAVLRLGLPSSPVDHGGGWAEWDPFSYGTAAPVPTGPVDRSYTLVLDRALTFPPRYSYTVNGKAFPDVPPLLVRTGELIEMTVVNRNTETHPWHLHGHRVLVLSRDGRAPTGSPLWMDSFDVRPGEVWRVAFRADNPGLWMNHCHNLPHADRGMALHVAYEGVTTPLSGAHGG